MITRSPDLDRYAAQCREFMERRSRKLAEIPESEVKEALGNEEYLPESVEDVLYPALSESEEGFYNFTGFTTEEFQHLLGITCQQLIFQGRGRKQKISEKDTLIVLLQYLRRYPRIEDYAHSLKIHPSSLERLIDKSITALSDYLYRKLVSLPSVNEALPLDPNFPEASLVVDATVQQINTPALSFDERKAWFSGKHFMYCLKSQVTVNMKGIAVHAEAGIPGATHDLEVLRSTKDDLENILRSSPKMPQKILADKGYVSDLPFLITPHKGNNLTRAQKLDNDRISKHRIIIENYYGRLKSRYAIIGSKYRGGHEGYEKIFKLCVSLINFEMYYLKHYLRKQDGDWYSRFRASELIAMKNRSVEKAEIRKEARLRRAARFGRNDESD